MSQPLRTYQNPPTIAVNLASIAGLTALHRESGLGFRVDPIELAFSCSSRGTWPSERTGPRPEEYRHYVDGRDGLLDYLSWLMIESEPDGRGGRFVVTLDGAYRLRDGLALVNFVLTA